MRSRILLAISLMLLALAAAPAQAEVENDETHWVGHDRASKVMSPPSGKIGR